ncbi:SDR family NAD(P)-dependent oxidoreductase [Erwiniaceae bacterium BAC15a-03b]|uniref:NADP-dependent 3-hydroxy acid dehydrogenase YdfG n=1 Tax=Winslowiella arboricola TaxID=2978220 RepID=A0A9J6PGZ5_9GAMM|nr:SDR family NAD(P)-dependent oxidoreductase [Winslowiella arboricola]MCU5771752.1 SDR family NAD(P)-dependent oxidoreductase [Winslowiella arboricola]MCU5777577.1 SDR family NAD(P)-dependent oxidoreductase [Winslowiella arboricola]
MTISNKKPVAMITGASSGIGAVYAQRFAARGYDLILISRRADRLKDLSADLHLSYATNTTILPIDLTIETDLKNAESVITTTPALKVLVNSAGNGKLGATTDIAAADLASTLTLNVTALTRLTYAALTEFLSRDQGTIINISSVMALHSSAITSLYSGTKAFVLNFSRGLQQELKGTQVRVQVVLPATTATEFHDQSGIPLSAFSPSAIMTTENLVDAALAGFDQGELVTLPSVHDISLWNTYESARNTLFVATQNGFSAPRYNHAHS